VGRLWHALGRAVASERVQHQPKAGETVDSTHEIIIIGAGPGGLQLGYFLGLAGLDYLILEADEVGSFFRRFPRTRELISFNKRHSIYADPEVRMRWDWNSLLTEDHELLFGDYSRRLYPDADELRRYLADLARHCRLNLRQGVRVARVQRDRDGWFRLDAEDGGSHRCRYLIVASGMSQPYIPPIPGIEWAEGYESASLDPADYHDKRVLFIGKGNSAFELADRILDEAALVHLASPTPIRLAWKTRHPGHLRAQYTRILDTYQLKTLNGALDCTIEEIARDDGGGLLVTVAYVHADGEQETFAYDRVIRCTGFRFDDSIYGDGCRPAMDAFGKLPEMTSGWESVNVPGLFFAGTLMQARDYKQASSAFIDGFRYNIRTLARLLLARAAGQPLAGRSLGATPEALTRAVIGRVSRTASLWAQFGYLCDAIVVDRASGTATYHEDLPRDYVFDCELGASEHLYTVDFEWGRWDGDVFAIDRHPRHDMAHTNVFLHPIVRRHRGAATAVAEHHILEDLLGMYRHEGESGFVQRRSGRDMRRYHLDEHLAPLYAFFAGQLAGADDDGYSAERSSQRRGKNRFANVDRR
jgi:thioredoxin reductase